VLKLVGAVTWTGASKAFLNSAFQMDVTFSPVFPLPQVYFQTWRRCCWFLASYCQVITVAFPLLWLKKQRDGEDADSVSVKVLSIVRETFAWTHTQNIQTQLFCLTVFSPSELRVNSSIFQGF